MGHSGPGTNGVSNLRRFQSMPRRRSGKASTKGLKFDRIEYDAPSDEEMRKGYPFFGLSILTIQGKF